MMQSDDDIENQKKLDKLGSNELVANKQNNVLDKLCVMAQMLYLYLFGLITIFIMTVGLITHFNNY